MAAAAQEKMERYAEEHNLTMKDFSSCDGGYISDVTGELVMCEVVTRFYTDEMIERKINFANAMGSQYEQHEA
jgi:hypothetical protein